jgi:hypothetical protein
VIDRDSGQTTVFIVGVSLLAFAVAGLAVDGTRAFLLRRTLQNAADSAAVAGAGELDRPAYYSSGGRTIRLDPRSASATAGSYLGKRGLGATSAIDADESSVHVVLRDSSPTTLLRIIGIDEVGVAVEAAAEPETEL